MAEIISIINQKGGVGKSTIAQAIGQGIKELYNKKVLLIDMDAQGNLSYALGADTDQLTILNVLNNECTAKDAVQHIETGDIIASSSFLSVIELKRPDVLKSNLATIKKSYDYIIIDTPPALSKITYNALTASDSVIIPALPDVFSLQGINQLYDTIKSVKSGTNKALKVRGILLTKYSDRTTLNQSVAEQLEETAKEYGTKLFKTRIRDAVAVREAQVSTLSIYKYAPRANVTKDFKQLIKEVIENG